MEYREHVQDPGLAWPDQTALEGPHTRAVARRRHGGRGMAGSVLLLGLLLPALVLANVGKNSCVGHDACMGNTGNVKNNACNGGQACVDNTGAVGNGSCVGDFAACTDNTGATIGYGSCNGLQACDTNQSTIGNKSCNADSGAHPLIF